MKSHIYAFTFGDKDNKILSNMWGRIMYIWLFIAGTFMPPKFS